MMLASDAQSSRTRLGLRPEDLADELGLTPDNVVAAKNLDERTKRLEQFVKHANECPTCRARRAYIEERFPPMPPMPHRGWLAIAAPISERINRLPVWARPAATGAVVFVAYSLFRLLVLLPAIIRSPVRGSIAAIEGIAASASIGAALGFLYGQYRRLRDRQPSRAT